MPSPSEVNALVAAALERKTPAERSAFLDLVCGADAELRQRVEQLLATQFQLSDSLVQSIAVPTTGTLPPAHAAQEPAPSDHTRLGPDADEMRRILSPRTVPDAGQRALPFLDPSTRPESKGRLAHFEILEVLGRGGMGVVLKAMDEKLQRVVALKVMAPELAHDATARQRFAREARTAAAVSHDNIVTIHAVEEEHQPPFLVMQFIEGISLAEKLRRTGPLPLAEVVRIGREIAAGLAAAHSQGLVHRDIKPANILLEKGTERVKITDFGLARGVHDSKITKSGDITGTPMYMSPEQADGKAVDHRSDLFSLGSVLFEMCTGEPPFQAPDMFVSMMRIITHEPTPISKLNPAIPRWLCEIIARLHAKAPAERYQLAQEVAELLGRFQAHLQHPSAAPMPKVALSPRSLAKRRKLIGAVAVVALLAVGLVVVMVKRWLPDEHLLPTKPGTLALHVPEADVLVWIDGVDRGSLGQECDARLEVPPGDHKVILKLGDETMHTEPFRLTSGGEAVITAQWTPRRYVNSLGMKFALVPKGKGWLGSRNGKVGDREVEFDRDFYLGVYEVTQDEWTKVLGPDLNPSHFSRSGEDRDLVKNLSDDDLKHLPVDSVSWDQCQQFLKALNARAKVAGWVYRLPTSDEWEYACRGGPVPAKDYYRFDFYLDKPTNTLPANRANFKDSALKRTCEVGSYPPNRLGLYDMHGNVFELCNDLVIDDDGRSLRRLRGGSWLDDAALCRAGRTASVAPSDNYNGGGMRVARVRE